MDHVQAPHPARQHAAVFAAFVLLLLASAFIAAQAWREDAAPAAPAASAALAGSLYLILTNALPILAIWLGAAGWGSLLLEWHVGRRRWRGMVMRTGVGMAVTLLAFWVLALPWGLPSPVGPVLFLAVGWARVAAMLLARIGDRMRPTRLPWELLLAAPPLAVLLLAATAPPGTLWRVEAYGYDVLSYHLQLPREWLAAGGMVAREHNVYGYFPSLLEATYFHLGALRGSVTDAIYTCQLFHASLAVFAAIATGAAVSQVCARVTNGATSRPGAGALAGAAILAVPWVPITGSLAYNEMAVLAFEATALLVLFSRQADRIRAAAAVGFLVGAATLTKLTAGPMVAVPIGLVLLTRAHRSGWNLRLDRAFFTRGVATAAVAALAGAVTLTPYLARNLAWTGNPTFPFATEYFGRAHWDADLEARWKAGHGAAQNDESRTEALSRQWLFNTGFGAVGGDATPRESKNIARFDTEGGVPLFLIAALGGGLLALSRPRLRPPVVAMGLILTVQLGFWLTATHLQSRFLVPTLPPLCVLFGLGYARLRSMLAEQSPIIAPIVGGSIVAATGVVTLTVLWQQTRQAPDDSGQMAPLPPYALVDSLEAMGHHPLDSLPLSSKVLLVADNSGLLYIDRPIVYHSAFDANPLGEILRATGGDPAATTEELRRRGITHVWIGWSEVERLHSTYGFDAAVTTESLLPLARGWTPLDSERNPPNLFRLPR